MLYWFAFPLQTTLIIWNYTETINVAIKLSTNVKVTINKTVCVCRAGEGKLRGTLCIPHVCSVSLSPSGADVVFVVKSRTRSLISHLTACPKQMGDSGNWHQRLRLAVAALSLLRCNTSPHPLIPSVKSPTVSNSQKRTPAQPHTAEVSAGQCNINVPMPFGSAPSFY